MTTTSILNDLSFRFRDMRFGGPYRAFTLLELLMVVAIVGILAACIFPALSAARRSAKMAKTRVQFAQWTAAIESFRSEYGHYPAFADSGLVNGGVTTTVHPFHDLLAAKHRDGTGLESSESAALQNRKAIRFHSFENGELSGAGLLRDAFENIEIAVLVDRDLDGVIKQGVDYLALPMVNGVAPSAQEVPVSGVRAGVIFYSPAAGGSSGLILSWK